MRDDKKTHSAIKQPSQVTFPSSFILSAFSAVLCAASHTKYICCLYPISSTKTKEKKREEKKDRGEEEKYTYIF